MKKIKIGHVINRAAGSGGVSTSVYHFLKELSDEKYDRHLYSLKPHDGDPNILDGQGNLFEDLGVKVVIGDQDSKKIGVVKNLSKWLLENQIDILHTHSYRPNTVGRLAGVLCKKIKIIAHYHNYYDNKWEKEDSLVFDQLLASYSDQMIASSEAVQKHISDKIGVRPEAIKVVFAGVDLEQFKTGIDSGAFRRGLNLPKDCKVVGIIGRISEQKAQDDFIEAARTIKDAVPNTVFLIVGGGRDHKLMDCLKNLVASLGLEKDVIFTGYIQDVKKVYAALDVLVVPSRWEGFGLILVEAMATGTPIVATDIGPIPEVVGSDGAALLVPPSSPDDIAAAVTRLLKNQEIAKAMARKGRRRSEMFSWNKAAMQLDDIYTKLMKGEKKRFTSE